MTKQNKEIPRASGRDTYLENEWEGGIAVYWVDGDYGTKIVAIPRLQLSTALMCDSTDHSTLITMLYKEKNFYHNRENAGQFANMILNGIRGEKHVRSMR